MFSNTQMETNKQKSERRNRPTRDQAYWSASMLIIFPFLLHSENSSYYIISEQWGLINSKFCIGRSLYDSSFFLKTHSKVITDTTSENIFYTMIFAVP